jgi:signal transduction histidine kinase
VKELRAALDVLHAGTANEFPRHPVAGLADVPRIIETAASGGLNVVLCVHGDSRPVPLIVDAAAQRIIQESITNTMRHAEATDARIELDYRLDQLVVRIADNGNGARNGSDQVMVGELGSGQYGIRGMRERANLLGGTLRTEPAANGGFVVEAVLPLQEQR